MPHTDRQWNDARRGIHGERPQLSDILSHVRGSEMQYSGSGTQTWAPQHFPHAYPGVPNPATPFPHSASNAPVNNFDFSQPPPGLGPQHAPLPAHASFPHPIPRPPLQLLSAQGYYPPQFAGPQNVRMLAPEADASMRMRYQGTGSLFESQPPVAPFQQGPPSFTQMPPPGGHIQTQGPNLVPGTCQTSSHAQFREPEQKKGSLYLKGESDLKLCGAQKLDSWLQKTVKAKKPLRKAQPKTGTPVQIWSCVNQLRGALQSVMSMSAQLEEMAGAVSSAESTSWESMRCSLDQMKDEYTRLEPLLSESSVKSMEEKLFNIRKKRARLRRARQAKFEEKERCRQGWEEKSQQISAWQEKHQAKIREENVRKARKAAADLTLSKVTKDIHDASHLIETMLALQKLRLIRRDAAQKRGETELGESRQAFETKIADMTRLVQSQLECYKEEEAKLKEVIKSEQEERSKKEKLVQEEKERNKQREEDKELDTVLFGPQEQPADTNPLFPYSQYYRQAENNLQAFVQIRHEWDAFIVPENTPASSRVPMSWVVPDPPSSPAWASALT